MQGDRTHIEDLEVHLQVLPPTNDPTFVALHLQESRGRIPFAILDDSLLYLCCSAMIKLNKRFTQDMFSKSVHLVNP